MRLRRMLTRRGAKRLADALAGWSALSGTEALADLPFISAEEEAEVDRLWRESDAAGAVLQKALEEAPDGADLKALPEYSDFMAKARAFREYVERLVGWVEEPTSEGSRR